MKIYDLDTQHKFFELNFELDDAEDKTILKQIIENFLLVEYARNCECLKSQNLEVNRKYSFTFDYDTEQKLFQELS